MPVFKASDDKYYISGPGERVYVRMSLEKTFGGRVTCHINADPSKTLEVYIGKSNPDDNGIIQRSEAVCEQYGYIDR